MGAHACPEPCKCPIPYTPRWKCFKANSTSRAKWVATIFPMESCTAHHTHLCNGCAIIHPHQPLLHDHVTSQDAFPWPKDFHRVLPLHGRRPDYNALRPLAINTDCAPPTAATAPHNVQAHVRDAVRSRRWPNEVDAIGEVCCCDLEGWVRVWLGTQTECMLRGFLVTRVYDR